jgi:hypothetical protein
MALPHGSVLLSRLIVTPLDEAGFFLPSQVD